MHVLLGLVHVPVRMPRADAPDFFFVVVIVVIVVVAMPVAVLQSAVRVAMGVALDK